MKTDKLIQEAAEQHAKRYQCYNSTVLLKYNSFKAGAKWMRSQSQWIPVTERLPLAFETGNWDGKKSSKVLVRTKDHRYFVAELYEGYMDGDEFHNFYDDRDFEIKDVEYWKDI